MMSEEPQHQEMRKYQDTFLTGKKASLHSKWLGPDSRISVNVYSSLAVAPEINFVYRILEINGSVNEYIEKITPTTDRLATNAIIRPGLGYLLSCAFISETATVRRGEVYANAKIRSLKDGRDYDLLCQGYVTNQCSPSWPDGKNESSVEGQGALKTITGTNPAAGAEISETVPANARWKLIAIRVSFVADANVANRTIAITFDDGTTVFLRLEDRTAITAGQTRNANANVFAVLPADTTTDHYFVLPDDMFLSQGYIIKTVTTNLQVGDNYGAPQLIVEEWIEE